MSSSLSPEERERLRKEYDFLTARFNQTTEESVREQIKLRLLKLQEIASGNARPEPEPEPELESEPTAVEPVEVFEPAPYEEPVVYAPSSDLTDLELERVAMLVEEAAMLQKKLEGNLEPMAKNAIGEKVHDITKRLEALGRNVDGTPNGKGPVRKDDLAPIIPPSPEQQRQAEDLVKRYQVAKQRGNGQEAMELIRQATIVAPTSAMVQEALGDEYRERGEMKNARDAYHLAHRAEPSNLAIDRKYAESVLRANRTVNVEDALKSGSIDSLLLSQDQSVARPGAAATLSFFLPGTGQLVRGKNVLGGIILGGWLIMFICEFTFKGHTISDLIHHKYDLVGILLLLGMFVFQVWSVAECLVTGDKKAGDLEDYLMNPPGGRR